MSDPEGEDTLSLQIAMLMRLNEKKIKVKKRNILGSW